MLLVRLEVYIVDKKQLLMSEVQQQYKMTILQKLILPNNWDYTSLLYSHNLKSQQLKRYTSLK